MKKVRFTADVVKAFLEANQGLQIERYVKERNFQASYMYIFKDGSLFKKVTGRTSWADSRFDNITEMTYKEIQAFLRDEYLKIGTKLKNPFE